MNERMMDGWVERTKDGTDAAEHANGRTDARQTTR